MIEPDARQIRLGSGHVCHVSAVDFDWLSRWKWQFSKAYGPPRDRRCSGYAARSQYKENWRDGRVKIYMHRLIMNPPVDILVDHRDGDGLNNCRSNLRMANDSQNGANAATRQNVTGYRGVYECREAGIVVAYGSSIVDPESGKRVYLGRVGTAEEAARRFDSAAIEYYGEFAKLNFTEVPF